MVDWKIPLFIPDFTDEDIQAVTEPIRDGWLTMGERTHRFEEVFAERLGVRYAIGVCNGTAALHLALAASGITAGDEVLVPSLTFVACANVITALGAIPVFTDVWGERDWTVSTEDVRRKISNRTRAAIVVHYAGFPCRMEELLPVFKRYKITIIEDCAHSLVSYRHGQSCGTFGNAGCFSFFSNKNMTTGEGGMVVTNSTTLAERIRLLRSHGMTTLTLDRYQGHAFSYDVTAFGFNYRIDEIRSALGLCQLQRLENNLRKRRQVYERYKDSLRDIDEILLPFSEREEETVGHHLFPILLRDPGKRDPLMQALRDQGIQTSIHYPAIHSFSAYRSYRDEAKCPLTESISTREITLPFYPQMTEEDVSSVCEAIKRNLVTSRR